MTTVGPTVLSASVPAATTAAAAVVTAAANAAQIPAANQAVFTVNNTPALNLASSQNSIYEISQDVQKLLVDNLPAIRELNLQRSPYYPAYERTVMLDGQPHEIVNTLTSVKGADKFTNIRPEELSSLVPMMKFYKIQYDEEGNNISKGKPLQITFDTHTRLGSGTGRLMQTSKSGVGIKSFEWQLNGSNKVARASDITAKLVLYFQNFNELLTPRPGGFAYYDLLVRPRGKKEAPPISVGAEEQVEDLRLTERELDPKFYEIQAVVGWAYNNDYIFDFNKKSGLADAVLRQRRTFFLTLEDHDFSINQDGTFTLTINYRARMGAVMEDSNRANILVDRRFSAHGTTGLSDDIENKKKLIQLRKETKARYEKRKNEGQQLDEGQLAFLEGFDANSKQNEQELNELKDKLIIKIQRSIITQLFSEERVYYATLQSATVMALPPPSVTNALNSGQAPLTAPTSVPLTPLKRPAVLLKLPEDKLGVKEQIQVFAAAIASSTSSTAPASPVNYFQEIIEAQAELDLYEERINQTGTSFLTGRDVSLLKAEKARLEKKIRQLNIQNSGIQTIGPRGLISNFSPSTNTVTEYKVPWVYYGDLVDIVAKNAFDNFRFDIGQPFTYTNDRTENLKILLGSIHRDPNQNISLANVADLPVALNLFRQFWKMKVINPGKEIYTIHDFIRDSIKYFFVESFTFNRQNQNTTDMVHPSDTTITLPETDSGRDPILEKAIVPYGNNLFSSRVGLSYLKDDPPNHKVQTNTTEYYEYKTYYISSKYSNFLEGDKRKDAKSNIMHLNIGRDRGLVKSVQFKRTDIEGIRELRVSQALSFDTFDPLSNLVDIYDVTITMFGNVLFWPGQYVYVNPIGLGTALGNPSVEGSKSRILGLGGYHLITNVSSHIQSGQYETRIEAKWETSGGKNSRSLRNSIAEQERRAKEANSSLPDPNSGTI